MSKCRLLLIDTDQARADQIFQQLQHQDFNVSLAQQGREALEKIRTNGYDIVITNILLSDMDGVEIVTAIREFRPALPIIIMSSSTQSGKTLKALCAGAHHFIRDPLDINELLDTIKKLERSQQEIVINQRVISFLTEIITFEIPSELALMSAAVQYINDILVRIGYLEEDDIHIKIALIEAVTNAIEHGNQHDATKKVKIHAKLTCQKAVFTVTDEGPGFDYKNLPDPTNSENINRVRGRGIFMIHHLMDRVRFNQPGNQIQMVKYRP